MIKPTTLYNFGKSCQDSAQAGRVLRAVCGQEVDDLSDADRLFVTMISNDNEWMNDNITAQREKWREARRQDRRKVKSRNGDNEANKDSLEAKTPVQRTNECPTDKRMSDGQTNVQRTNECLISSLPPSLPSSYDCSMRDKSLNRNRNKKTHDEIAIAIDGHSSEVKRFRAALSCDESGGYIAITDPSHDVAVVACAITETGLESVRRWQQAAKVLGDEVMRECIYDFHRELCSGFSPESKGAAFNAHITKMMDAAKGAN